jgi:hypothetical protein
MDRVLTVNELEKNLRHMRNLILALLFASPFMALAQTDPGTTVNAMVTVRIGALSESAWPKVTERISREANVSVEYSCLTTGILVLRLQHITVSDKADVMALVKRLLHEGGVKGTIEFLDVQVFHESTNRCALPGMDERRTVGSAS